MGNYREISPGAQLAERVECFWISETAAAVPLHRVLPDGCADIIYTRSRYGSALRFVGPMTRFADFPQQAESVSVGIRFRPAMWSGVVRFGGADSANCVLPMEALWGKKASQLTRYLDDCDDPGDRIQEISQWLGPAPARSAFELAIAGLEQSKGVVPLDVLALDACMSTRQFRRNCLKATALSPKLLARILRFRHAHQQAARRISGVQVALNCGYADQSHLIAEFREFSGTTPKLLSGSEHR